MDFDLDIEIPNFENNPNESERFPNDFQSEIFLASVNNNFDMDFEKISAKTPVELAKKLFLMELPLTQIADEIFKNFGKKVGKTTISDWAKKNKWKEQKDDSVKAGIKEAIRSINQEAENKPKEKTPPSSNPSPITELAVASQLRYSTANKMRDASVKAIFDTLFKRIIESDDLGRQVEKVVVNPDMKAGTALNLAIQLYRAANEDISNLEDILKDTPRMKKISDETWFDEIENKL